MIFNKHSALEGQHAFLGASKYHWINYDESKVAESYSKFLATQKGTELTRFCSEMYYSWSKLPKSQKTLNMYVNDAIGFKMIPEQPLFYSENCFGTTVCNRVSKSDASYSRFKNRCHSSTHGAA